MTEFTEVVRNRRMTRAFAPEPLDHGQLDRLVDLAGRAPSAGKSQGWHLVALEGDETARYWDVALPRERRATFRWSHLLDAPVVLLAFADPHAYVERYAQDDKSSTGLGAGVEAWPAPYWTIDASMAVMTLLLAAEDEGLGALLFAVFRSEEEIRASLGVPERMVTIGAVALGRPHPEPAGRGRSASRPRRTPAEIVHRGGW
ncbi:nitroreductase family protein [Ilumatobacter sp.]|uniref:nitroreductase family protein n=1 Tax=Ilumatobacter sp. TaxID=1967498 RepID=UPI003B52BF18